MIHEKVRQSQQFFKTSRHHQFFIQVDVVMRYHESALEDFSGFLQVDSYSNALLNLTLMDVTGTIHGTISSNNFTQVTHSDTIIYTECPFIPQCIYREGHAYMVKNPMVHLLGPTTIFL